MTVNESFLGLHLGAEYNESHGAAGPSMNELVRQFLDNGSLPDNNYFTLLVEQVACFGDPRHFYYDDVSRVRAGGSHTREEVYQLNVNKSVGEIVTLISELDPRIIVVAGSLAFKEFTRQILPHLPHWQGDLVKTRNPSTRGHWGPSAEWEQRYRSFRTDLALEPRPQLVRKWHLHASDVRCNLELRRL